MKRLILLALCFLFLAACAVPLPFAAATPTPTQPAVVFSFNVTVIPLGPTATPTQIATPTEPPTLTPTPTLVFTSALTATAEVIELIPPTPEGAILTPSPVLTATDLAALPLSPLAGPTAVVTPTVAVTPAIESPAVVTPTVAAAPEATPATGVPTAGIINLIGPEQNSLVPAHLNQLDFKWQWKGSLGCSGLPEGYGFELRVWPAVTGYGPLGVMDAVANQKDIGCDLKTGIYNYRVIDLRGTPGVRQMDGTGKFLWDVAYIQMDPYSVIVASQPGLFEVAGQ